MMHTLTQKAALFTQGCCSYMGVQNRAQSEEARMNGLSSSGQQYRSNKCVCVYTLQRLQQQWPGSMTSTIFLKAAREEGLCVCMLDKAAGHCPFAAAFYTIRTRGLFPPIQQYFFKTFPSQPPYIYTDIWLDFAWTFPCTRRSFLFQMLHSIGGVFSHAGWSKIKAFNMAFRSKRLHCPRFFFFSSQGCSKKDFLVLLLSLLCCDSCVAA